VAKPTTAPAAPAPTSAAAAAPTTAPAAPAPTAATSSTAKPAASSGGTLRSSELGGAPKILHPYPESQQYTTPWSDGATLMWAGLIDIDWEKVEFVADPRRSMAKEMPKISNEGRTFTFTLRDDIKWSDGKPITSADFQFAWDNASKKENNYVGLQSLDRIESYRTPDAKTIEVTLKQPLARFLAISTAADIIPVPKHIWEGKPWLDPAGNPEILKPTVVSGPYLPKEISAERHAYSRLPSFWGKEPNLDEVAFINASQTTILELLKTQQVEWSESVPPSQYEDAKKLPNANVVEWSGATGSYRTVEFNSQRAPFTDKNVREALSRAINREDLLQFEENLAVPQFGLYTQGSKWRNDSVERYAFDLAKSKQLLQQAGLKLDGSTLKDASGQPIKIEIIWPTTSQPRGKMATYLQQQWKQLGVETTVTGLEFNAFVDKQSRQKDFDVAMGSWSAGLDPDGSKSQLITGGTQNSVGYSNPKVDELFEKGAAEQDDAKRKQIYDEIQTIVTTDLPIYYMVTLKNLTAFDKKVGGVSPLKGGDVLRQNNLQVVDWYLSQ
jgi:peptide/nickel transport system substrate-binding protein